MVQMIFFHKTFHFLTFMFTRSIKSVLPLLTFSCQVRFFVHFYTTLTCTYVRTALQNGLQISSAKKFFMTWYLSGTEFSQTNYLFCTPCGTWKGKLVFSTELSLNDFCPKANNISQSCPTVSSTITVTVWLCACTGLLVQHSLTVITINSSLTQCTVGADQMLTNVYAVSCQCTTVHIVTQCDIKTTNLPYT